MKNLVHFTTEDIASASTRVAHCVSRIFEESARILAALVGEVLTLMPLLSRVSESVAMLDLLHGFAVVARGGGGAGGGGRALGFALCSYPRMGSQQSSQGVPPPWRPLFPLGLHFVGIL